MLKRYLTILAVGLSLAFAPLVPAESSAVDAVRTTVNAVLDILKNNSMDREGKRSAMATEIGQALRFRRHVTTHPCHQLEKSHG